MRRDAGRRRADGSCDRWVRVADTELCKHPLVQPACVPPAPSALSSLTGRGGAPDSFQQGGGEDLSLGQMLQASMGGPTILCWDNLQLVVGRYRR